ncbi:hypothetical protein E3E22_09665 [Thermococcus sp. MV5]|uniref:hypothetical protein n=1 Tax=Thermococcus sp. MV5 TaxID=1638272 RepID=UPI0014399014|nr:hypothetical protein [Thermococcus sp. MV5]NJE26873.1 hypothetical protein [Thermococcus sp. MV5]
MPQGWKITSWSTSYRDRTFTNISNWISVLVTSDPTWPVKYHVYIGPAGYDPFFCRDHSCGGGVESIFIELVPEKNSKNLTLNVGVGSTFKYIKDGRKVLVAPVTYKNITVLLKE